MCFRFSLRRDTLKDVDSGINLHIISVQETLKDKKKYVSPLVALLKEKGLENDGFDPKSRKRSFECSWQISEHTLFLTSLSNKTEQRFDDLFLSNPNSEVLDPSDSRVELNVKASWFSGVIVTSHGYPMNAKDKNGVAYYITEGNCTKKRALHVKAPYPFGKALVDFIENEIDLSKVIQ